MSTSSLRTFVPFWYHKQSGNQSENFRCGRRAHLPQAHRLPFHYVASASGCYCCFHYVMDFTEFVHLLAPVKVSCWDAQKEGSQQETFKRFHIERDSVDMLVSIIELRSPLQLKGMMIDHLPRPSPMTTNTVTHNAMTPVIQGVKKEQAPQETPAPPPSPSPLMRQESLRLYIH